MSGRILLMTPTFYGIEDKIKAALEESGYEVIWIENKTQSFDYHGTYSKLKLLRRIYFRLFFPRERYIKRTFRKIDNRKFDLLFSINCHSVCPFLFRILKCANPGLFSVLYLWDSSSMYNWSGELGLFNKVSSFDPEDCIKYKIAYKPIFYTKTSQDKNIRPETDLFFAGKFSIERLTVLDKILKPIHESDLRSYVRLWPAYKIMFHNHIIYYILKKLNLRSYMIRKYLLNFEAYEGILKRDFITPEMIGFNEVQSRLKNSNVVLDLPYPKQAGYTHRLVEALPNGKKVLTTNRQITNESFFNPDQIHLIDPLNPVTIVSWIKEKAEFPVDNFFYDLELSLWLKSLLNVRMA